jgi:hypothetical protein
VTVVIEFQQQFLNVSLTECRARAMLVFEIRQGLTSRPMVRVVDEGEGVKGVQGDRMGR